MRLDPALHYLDNAATTMVDPAVAAAVSTALTGQWANPSSLYAPALYAQNALQKARTQVAKTLGCRPDEVYFTAGGSEGNNLALLGAAAARCAWGKKIVVTGFEHPSVQRPLRALADRGWQVMEIAPEADGRLDLDKMTAAVDKTTALVACMAVNNETGAKQDIARLSAAVKAKNPRTAVHVDAVQAWLRQPLDMHRLLPCVDTLAVSGHKIHAPKGVGALYICDNQRQHIRPPYLGGHQERGIRPGTENLPYIIGLGLAAEQGARTMNARAAAVTALHEQLYNGLQSMGGITFNSPPLGAGGTPELLNFSTGRVNSQTMIEFLSERQVYISGGSACDKGEPSHTLLAMGCPDSVVKTALRASFCADNTPDDVTALLEGLQAGLNVLRHAKF